MNGSQKNSIEECYRQYFKYLGNHSDEIKQIKQIITNNNSDKEKLFSVEGIWAHQKLLNTNIEIKSFILCHEYFYSDDSMLLINSFLNKAEDAFAVSKKVFEKLSERDDPDGFISIGKFPQYDVGSWNLKADSTIVVLDGLESPGNIGTILRSCDGAGVNAVFICNKRSRITNSKLIKSSMGAVFVIPVIEFDNVYDCISWLRVHGFHIYLADTRARNSFKDCEYKGNIALVMGSERYGISGEWYNTNPNLLNIPMFGICDSLNVGTAASIMLYEICLKKLNISHEKVIL